MECKISFSFIIPFLILVGCTFSPEHEFINKIERPKDITASITIDDPNFTDPFNLVFPTEFIFETAAIQNPIKGYEVLFRNEIIAKGEGGSPIKFTINPFQAQTGKYEVLIRIQIATNSGSLAEKLNLEYYLFEKKFNVLIDNQLPDVTLDLKSTKENGLLKLYWPSLTKLNFRYEIRKFSIEQFGYETYIEKDFIEKANQFHYIDSGYVGGRVKYYLYLFNGISMKLAGSHEVKQSPYSSFKYEIDQDNNQVITWETELNTENANISFESNEWANAVPFSKKTITGGKTFIGEIDNILVSLSRFGHSQQKYDTSIAIKHKPNIPSFEKLIILLGGNEVLLKQRTSIQRLSMVDFTELDRITTGGSNARYDDILTSENGNFGVCTIADIYSITDSRGVIRLNPNNLNQPKLMGLIYNPDQGYYEYIRLRKISSITNQELVGANIYIGNQPAAVILNPNSEVIEDGIVNPVEWSDKGNTMVPTLSENGDFFLLSNQSLNRNEIYKKVSGNWNLAGLLPYSERYFVNSGLVILVDETVKIFDPTQTIGSNQYYSLLREFNYKNILGNEVVKKVEFDQLTKNLYFQLIDESNFSYLHIFNLTNFSKVGVATAYITNEENKGQYEHVYLNNHHYLSSGYFEKIK